MRKHWIDNLRWVTVLLVLLYHVIYFYTLVGERDKAARRVRDVFDRFYLPKPDGLCGNDDCGQMSAWYVFSALGFGVWGDIKPCGMDFLSFFDFATSCVLMPIAALLTCIFVGWVLTPKAVVDECEAEGHVFRAKGFYAFLVKFVAPAFVGAILVSEICRCLGIVGWSI